MNESSLWRYVAGGMANKWHATRIESSAGNGVPDVSFGMISRYNGRRFNGFLELKYIPQWPKKDETNLKLPLRPEQKIWIQTRGGIAGDVWVLCRICDDFILFSDAQALCANQGQTQKWWMMTNYLYCCRRLDFKALAGILSEGY